MDFWIRRCIYGSRFRSDELNMLSFDDLHCFFHRWFWGEVMRKQTFNAILPIKATCWGSLKPEKTRRKSHPEFVQNSPSQGKDLTNELWTLIIDLVGSRAPLFWKCDSFKGVAGSFYFGYTSKSLEVPMFYFQETFSGIGSLVHPRGALFWEAKAAEKWIPIVDMRLVRHWGNGSTIYVANEAMLPFFGLTLFCGNLDPHINYPYFSVYSISITIYLSFSL